MGLMRLDTYCIMPITLHKGQTMTPQIRAYIDAFDSPTQARLIELHTLIESALTPEIEQVIYYNLPTFMVKGKKRPLCVYSVATHHISFVTTDSEILQRYKPRLAGYKISGTTLQLPFERPLPREVIIDIVRERIDTVSASVESKTIAVDKPIHEMPDFVLSALENANLMEEYYARPAYQQNDYLGWIAGAKTDATRQKRLTQMLDELSQGGVYMKMPHPASMKR